MGIRCRNAERKGVLWAHDSKFTRKFAGGKGKQINRNESFARSKSDFISSEKEEEEEEDTLLGLSRLP